MSGEGAGSRVPRILMTTDAVGGVWTYSLDLAAGLASVGAETILVSLGPPATADQRAQAAETPRLTLIETGLPLDWLASEPAEILEVGAALRGLARAEGVDLVHLNSPAYAAIGAFPVPVVGVCHSCTATWWSAVKEGPMPADFRWRSQVLWQGMIACDLLTAPSEAFATATARTYEVPRPFVIHNGRRPPQLPPARRQPRIFTSGRLWDEGKNVAVLDAAAGLARVPLYAAGPLQAPDGGAASLEHARALGRLPAQAVYEQLAQAPVFASAALYEPFGLGVLEAAQAGCALVLSDIPTFRELWEGAAIFAPADDAASFAQAFDSLLSDPVRTGRLGQAAQARAAQFTVDSMAGGMIEVYRLRRPDLFPPLHSEAAA